MGNGTDGKSGWLPVISSVKTPLGFFTLVILIVDGVIGVSTPFTQIPVLAPLVVLVLVIVLVFVIVLVRPQALYSPDKWQKVRMTVNLNFEEPNKVDLEEKRCKLIVRKANGKTKQKKPNLKYGFGGYSVVLDPDLDPTDSVSMELVESNGRRWRVRGFAPYESVQEPFLVEGDSEVVP